MLSATDVQLLEFWIEAALEFRKEYKVLTGLVTFFITTNWRQVSSHKSLLVLDRPLAVQYILLQWLILL